MKRLLMIVLLIGMVPMYLHADEFGDFRIPRNTYYSWTLNFNGYYSPQRQESSPNYQSYRDYNGSLNTGAAWGLDSDELSRYLSVSANAQGDHYYGRYKQENFDSYYRRVAVNKNHQDRISEQWTVKGSCRRYPWSAPFGLEIGASLKGSYTQEWYNYSDNLNNVINEPYQTNHQISGFRRTSWYYNYDFSADAAFGYGRVRNATSIYSVDLLERRLLETGTLIKPLSAETRTKIASLYYAEGGFGSAHDRAGKFFWRELERILREDGALCADGLDGYSLNRADEPYSEIEKINRQKGWFAGISISAGHQRIIDRTAETNTRQIFYDDTLHSEYNSYSNSHDDFWNDQVAVGAEAEYHLPMGMRWQFDWTGRILFPVDDLNHGLDLESAAEAHYIIADRWTLSAAAGQARQIGQLNQTNGAADMDEWWVSYGMRLSFFVEDHVRIGLDAEETQEVVSPSTWYMAQNNRAYERGLNVSLNLTYRFMGAFDMPGLINPVRMLPFPK